MDLGFPGAQHDPNSDGGRHHGWYLYSQTGFHMQSAPKLWVGVLSLPHYSLVGSHHSPSCVPSNELVWSIVGSTRSYLFVPLSQQKTPRNEQDLFLLKMTGYEHGSHAACGFCINEVPTSVVYIPTRPSSVASDMTQQNISSEYGVVICVTYIWLYIYIYIYTYTLWYLFLHLCI